MAASRRTRRKCTCTRLTVLAWLSSQASRVDVQRIEVSSRRMRKDQARTCIQNTTTALMNSQNVSIACSSSTVRSPTSLAPALMSDGASGVAGTPDIAIRVDAELRSLLYSKFLQRFGRLHMALLSRWSALGCDVQLFTNDSGRPAWRTH